MRRCTCRVSPMGLAADGLGCWLLFFADCLHLKINVIFLSNNNIFSVLGALNIVCVKLFFLTRPRLSLCFVFARRGWIAGVKTSLVEGNGVGLFGHPTSFVHATCTSFIHCGVLVRQGKCAKCDGFSLLLFQKDKGHRRAVWWLQKRTKFPMFFVFVLFSAQSSITDGSLHTNIITCFCSHCFVLTSNKKITKHQTWVALFSILNGHCRRFNMKLIA